MMFGIYPIVAKHFKMFFGDVDNEFLNEVQSRNGFSNSFIVFVSGVMKGYIFAVISINTRCGNNRSAEVSADVFNGDIRSAKIWLCTDIKLDPGAAAACEFLLDVIVDMGVTITPQIANCLYTGIATDTGCFKFASTTPRTHMAAARVMEAGADVEKLNARLFESRSHARITAERMAMESLEYYFNDLCAVICLTWDQIESSGVAGAELEDLTSLPRSIEGVEVGLTYRQQRDGSFRISVRTSGNIDACNIARRLGGGGHARAAGCEISGNLDNAKHAVLEEVRKELQRCGLLDQDAG